MKCFGCNYEYKERKDALMVGNNFDIVITKGDEPFCKLVHFFIERREDFGKDNIEESKMVYACPKCGTLKIKVN